MKTKVILRSDVARKTFALLIGVLIQPIAMSLAFADDSMVKTDDGHLYYSPTPKLEITLMDLGSDGGILSVGSDYDSEQLRAQYERLVRENQDLKVTAVMGTAADAFWVSLPLLRKSWQQEVRQSQTGPYFNGQYILSANELKKIQSEARTSTLAKLIVVTAPVKFQYDEVKTIETYKTTTEICRRIKGRNTREMILNLANLSKPTGVNLDSTFADYKANILDSCFELNGGSARSFTELMDLPLYLNPVTREVKGLSRETHSEVIQFNQRFNVSSTLN